VVVDDVVVVEDAGGAVWGAVWGAVVVVFGAL
jgi:hypothetical protein